MAAEIVFITGSTGFIGSHVVAVTLAAGYRVRLSIRKPEQAKAIFDRYPEYTSQIETVIFKEITNAESYGQNLKDVSYVFHIASPMPGAGAGDDVEADFVRPAVRGTTAILDAALHHPSIKKVIIDSSCLAFITADTLSKPNVTLRGMLSTVSSRDAGKLTPPAQTTLMRSFLLIQKRNFPKAPRAAASSTPGPRSWRTRRLETGSPRTSLRSWSTLCTLRSCLGTAWSRRQPKTSIL